jgi:hypothetical protein
VIQFDLASFAAHVARAMNNNVEEAKKIALEVGAKMIQHEAKRVIGIYLFDWPQLAPSTQAERHACRQSRECSLWGRRLHPRTAACVAGEERLGLGLRAQGRGAAF